ncbi:MAG: type II toxin-antitoxin system VapC family toxin [Candidatus Odinarchaeia archaeon]
MVIKILFDTNFLLVPVQFNINVVSEIDRLINFKYEIIILEASLKELKKIYETAPLKLKQQIKFALKHAEEFSVIKYENSTNVDDLIVKFALENKPIIVATNDSALRKKLRKNGVPVIYLRQKRRLAIDGEIVR